MKQKIRGVIEFYNTVRNYGFIKVEQAGKIFKFFLVLTNVVIGRPEVGSVVAFHIGEIPRGKPLPLAINCEVLGFDSAFLDQQSEAVAILADPTIPLPLKRTSAEEGAI